jgi:hypothetical protein
MVVDNDNGDDFFFDDITDYTEEDVRNLQIAYEEGKLRPEYLTDTQTNLLFSRYMTQIQKLGESNEEKRKMLLDYRDKMK